MVHGPVEQIINIKLKTCSIGSKIYEKGNCKNSCVGMT